MPNGDFKGITIYIWLVCFFTTITTANADETKTINWFYPDWRPGFLEGYTNGRETGFADRILKHVQAHLPSYRHNRLKLNWARWERMVATRLDICFSSGFYRWPDANGKPREDLVWSPPYLTFSYHGLVTHRNNGERLGPPPISLRALLHDETLTMVIEQDRTYSQPVAELIRQHPDGTNIIERPAGGDSTTGILRMLATGRADYALEYPVSFRYNAQKANVQSELIILPISEHADLFGLVSTVCSDTALGRKVVDEISQQIGDIAGSTEMRAIAEDCCILEGMESRYWQEFEKMRSHLPLE